MDSQGRKSINIPLETWQQLSILKANQNLNSIAKVIAFLLIQRKHEQTEMEELEEELEQI